MILTSIYFIILYILPILKIISIFYYFTMFIIKKDYREIYARKIIIALFFPPGNINFNIIKSIFKKLK